MSDHGLTALLTLHPVIQHHVVNDLGWPGLRPLQAGAVEPVLDDVDCLLLAPTAGGKTEAASFPLLTRMVEQRWTGISVLYLCPLRALLNNLAPRLHRYASWLGRSAAVWHGDVGPTERARILRERPDILLTTPESLEAMLVSTKVDAASTFAGLQAVVVDEVHAFAGDDRGHHLLAVLSRLSVLAGRSPQRIGLSATVGNPDALLHWLQGGAVDRSRVVVAPDAQASAGSMVAASAVSSSPAPVPAPVPTPEITLDHVGTIDNAAKIIATLHRGEKRLVFADSRRRAEELSAALRARDITTFLSHSSLSAAERRRSEEAFAEARDCVIVATSTLELGIDVGDLDRVIQLDAPRTVASFLQRLGRTGRRQGSSRNCLFLCLESEAVLHTAGLLERWQAGWVEPVVPPPVPRHIAAQQFLALALQEHRFGINTWQRWWPGLDLFAEDGQAILQHLLTQGYLELDGDLAFIGPEAERRFGRRYFSDLTAVFSAPPEFTVLAGREEIGTVGDQVLLAKVENGPRVLLLAGRTWKVGHIDWKRRRCFVEPSELPGRAKWSGAGGGASFEVARGMRSVLLGTPLPTITHTRRAEHALAELRARHEDTVVPKATVIRRVDSGETWWWTWAGAATNRTLHTTLPALVDPRQRIGDRGLRLRPELSFAEIGELIRQAPEPQAPEVDEQALTGLKFSAALPPELAAATVAQRLVDAEGCAAVLAEPRILAAG